MTLTWNKGLHPDRLLHQIETRQAHSATHMQGYRDFSTYSFHISLSHCCSRRIKHLLITRELLRWTRLFRQLKQEVFIFCTPLTATIIPSICCDGWADMQDRWMHVAKVCCRRISHHLPRGCAVWNIKHMHCMDASSKLTHTPFTSNWIMSHHRKSL